MRTAALLPILLAVPLAACPPPATTTKEPDTSEPEPALCTWYSDLDADGYGDPAAPQEGPCDVPPAGTVEDRTDCDDARADVHPGASETCDGADQDCDGSVDDRATDAATWWEDGDGDGHGVAASSRTACEVPDGYAASSDDCNDANADVHPGAAEVCNHIDDDCDGRADNGAADASTWWLDADGDGFAGGATSTSACDAPGGYHVEVTDCDDARADVFPGATEACDGADQDCDGSVDDAAVDATTWYADADGDGYGDPTAATIACDPPTGSVAEATDCDDARADVFPGAPETCDGVDQDCDGAVDEEAADAPTWYADADADGYGDPTAATIACDAPTGFVADATDCDDARADAFPGAPEICDGADQDCDPSTSEAGLVTFVAVDGTISDLTDVLWAGTASGPVLEVVADDGTLSFCGGTWYVLLDLQASVSVRGLAGSEPTVLDGGSAGSILSVTGDDLYVDVEGLTLQNGAGSGIVAGDYDTTEAGGGIACIASGTFLDLVDVTVVDSVAEYGGGIAVDGCALSMDGGSVSDNTADVAGGGLFLADLEASLSGTRIEGNTATHEGGGLYAAGLRADTALVLTDAFVAENTANVGGGLVVNAYASAADAVLHGVEIAANTAATEAGGLYVSGYEAPVDVLVDACTVSGNVASYGGGLSSWGYTDAEVALVDTLVSGNEAWTGGGAWVDSATRFTCEASASSSAGFLGNLGGGLYLSVTEPFSSTTCDWGTAAGGTDNTEFDVYVVSSDTAPYRFGDDATFGCTGSLCDVVETVSISTPDDAETTTAAARGNVYSGLHQGTIVSACMTLEVAAPTSVYGYVLTRATGGTGVWSSDSMGVAEAPAGSSCVEVPFPNGIAVEEGTDYAVVFYVPGSSGATWYGSTVAGGTTDGVGPSVGYWAGTRLSLWLSPETDALVESEFLYAQRLTLAGTPGTTPEDTGM